AQSATGMSVRGIAHLFHMHGAMSNAWWSAGVLAGHKQTAKPHFQNGARNANARESGAARERRWAGRDVGAPCALHASALDRARAFTECCAPFFKTPMPIPTVTALKAVQGNTKSKVEAELSATGGLLRLAPCWVPRSFLQPGKRLKLHPDDLYAFGLNRGGIDERWFASTTPAANDNRTPDEGLSYVVFGEERFTLQQAVAECGADLIGKKIWDQYQRWPVYSKFFDNMEPIPHHMHQ